MNITSTQASAQRIPVSIDNKTNPPDVVKLNECPWPEVVDFFAEKVGLFNYVQDPEATLKYFTRFVGNAVQRQDLTDDMQCIKSLVFPVRDDKSNDRYFYLEQKPAGVAVVETDKTGQGDIGELYIFEGYTFDQIRSHYSEYLRDK